MYIKTNLIFVESDLSTTNLQPVLLSSQLPCKDISFGRIWMWLQIMGAFYRNIQYSEVWREQIIHSLISHIGNYQLTFYTKTRNTKSTVRLILIQQIYLNNYRCKLARRVSTRSEVISRLAERHSFKRRKSSRVPNQMRCECFFSTLRAEHESVYLRENFYQWIKNNETIDPRNPQY